MQLASRIIRQNSEGTSRRHRKLCPDHVDQAAKFYVLHTVVNVVAVILFQLAMEVVEVGPHGTLEHELTEVFQVVRKFFHVLCAHFLSIVQARRTCLHAIGRIRELVWAAVKALIIFVHHAFLLLDALRFLDILANVIRGFAQLIVLSDARGTALELLELLHNVVSAALRYAFFIFE